MVGNPVLLPNSHSLLCCTRVPNYWLGPGLLSKDYFLAFLVAGWDSETKFWPMECSWKCWMQLLANIFKGLGQAHPPTPFSSPLLGQGDQVIKLPSRAMRQLTKEGEAVQEKELGPS